MGPPCPHYTQGVVSAARSWAVQEQGLSALHYPRGSFLQPWDSARSSVSSAPIYLPGGQAWELPTVHHYCPLRVAEASGPQPSTVHRALGLDHLSCWSGIPATDPSVPMMSRASLGGVDPGRPFLLLLFLGLSWEQVSKETLPPSHEPFSTQGCPGL